jgi:hypothetical protein
MVTFAAPTETFDAPTPARVLAASNAFLVTFHVRP